MHARFALAASLILAAVSPARAEPEPLVVSPGEVRAGGIVDINLSDEAAFEPVVIALDGAYGAAEGLELALAHSSERTRGFYLDQNAGFCVTGQDSGCIDFYDGPALLARYRLAEGNLSAAADGGLVILSLSDPFAASVKLGALIRWNPGAFWLELAPNLYIAFAGRTVESMGVEVDFNKERLHIPLTAGFSVTGSIDAVVQLGVSGQIDGFGDTFASPVAAGLRIAIDERLSALAIFGFDDLYGGRGEFDLDGRRLGLAASYRFTSM